MIPDLSVRRLLHVAALLVLALPLSPAAQAEPLARSLFGAANRPSQQASEPIGTYARGCAAGLVPLPETGPTWQAMRLSRNRNWGQPEMISYLEDLSVAATKVGWAGLYIGDISQPRGGPMTGGHASHQIGLDADIWMLPPKRVNLTAGEREKISSISVRTNDQTRVNGNWTPAHAALLQAAASDPRVDRIFVAAAVKIDMCLKSKPQDAAWLQKIRPYFSHNEHFHVRLKCPAGARYCETQTPTVSELSKGGSGCDATLNWWVTTYLEELRNPPKPAKPLKPATKPAGPPPRTTKTFILSDLPAQCANVLASR